MKPITVFEFFFALTSLENALIDFGHSNTVGKFCDGLDPGFVAKFEGFWFSFSLMLVGPTVIV